MILNEKDKFRSIMIRSITIIFIINTILLCLYLTFAFNKTVAYRVNKTKTYVDKKFDIIEKKLENNFNDIKRIANDHYVYITLKDENNEIIFDNKKESNLIYEKSKMIYINDTIYMLSVSSQLDLTLSLLISRIMFIELFILLVITIVSYKLISKKILIPINNLKNDMISYKKGIMPERRDKTTTIDELQNNFIDLTVALESEKEKQNQIIASITHDIKTPLTSIMGYAKRLETVKLSEEKKVEYIKKISSKSIRMKELISEFDDYLGCNLNSNLDKKPILIKDYILSIRKEFEEELKEKNIKLRIKNKTHSNDEIIIDEVKMKRVFSNIINNSIRYLQGDNKIIKILIEKKEENIRFEIMDNGIGVEKNIIDKIFDPLFTTDSGRKISGLGLSICREIIKVHQGEIKAKNNRYGGLSIIFYLPSNYDII